jgi:hypothetical protein
MDEQYSREQMRAAQNAYNASCGLAQQYGAYMNQHADSTGMVFRRNTISSCDWQNSYGLANAATAGSSWSPPSAKLKKRKSMFMSCRCDTPERKWAGLFFGSILALVVLSILI